MQPSKNAPTDIKKQRRRPRRRSRHRKRRTTHSPSNKPFPSPITKQAQNLTLVELSSEAHALEKQLNELQNQLKLNRAAVPGKEQGRRAIAIAKEQIATTEDEIDYVRKSLQHCYRQILTTDIHYAVTHHVEEKLWRYIFYARTEELRQRLRLLKEEPDNDLERRTIKEFVQHIDAAFKFYRELNSKIKAEHHIDAKTIGIDVFRNSGSTEEEHIVMLLQANYVCMGDLARYRASQSKTEDHSKTTGQHWSLAKSCYQEAIHIYRLNGKPYSQLALVSLSSGSAIDVVWYYCMSLYMKIPSTVGRDNLRSFYSKIRFSTNHQDSNDSKDGNSDARKTISQFVERFMQFHREIMFGNCEKVIPSTVHDYLSAKLNNSLAQIIAVAGEGSKEEDLPKKFFQLLHILKNTMIRTVTTMLITVWDLNQRMKDKALLSRRPQLQEAQLRLLTVAFLLMASIEKAVQHIPEKVQSNMDEITYQKMVSALEASLLPPLSIWCTFCFSNVAILAQYCANVGTESRPGPKTSKKELVTAVQSLLVSLIQNLAFPDPVDNLIPVTYPTSEDLLLLGLCPLAPFQITVDFFRENAYDAIMQQDPAEVKRQVRWGRIREFVKKLAESPSFAFIQYNPTEQNYSVIDENAKRQQQNRFMKALATQRLIEQVSSLEKNVNNMGIHSLKPSKEAPPDVYTVVIDVTAFLDGLNKIKKWANQTVNPNMRHQQSILEVIVPLETIDLLDDHKKGTSHMNVQARESIRYLDQKLLKSQSDQRNLDAPTESYLRTQKVTEKLSDWGKAAAYWIGEETRSNIVDRLLCEMSEDEDTVNPFASDDSDAASTSSVELPMSRRRRHYEEDASEDEMDGSDNDDRVIYEESMTEESENQRESDDDASDSDVNEEDEDEEDEEQDEEESVTFNDVPQAYRPIINCMLFYHENQQKESKPPVDKQAAQVEKLVLVTNDEDLAWWAEMFGDPKNKQRLHVKTVNEWDRIISTLNFEKAFEHSSRRR